MSALSLLLTVAAASVGVLDLGAVPVTVDELDAVEQAVEAVGMGVPPAEVSAALAGLPSEAGARLAARRALRRARERYAALRHEEAGEAAAAAARALGRVSLQAPEARGALVEAEVYRLLAARQLSRAAEVARAAAVLRALRPEAAEPPPGIDAGLWSELPPAGEPQRVRLELARALPPGVAVHVDLRPVDPPPTSLRLAPGPHLVDLEGPGVRVRVEVQVELRGPGAEAAAAPITLTAAPDGPDPLADLRATAVEVRRSPRLLTPALTARLCARAEVEALLAVSLAGDVADPRRLTARLHDPRAGLRRAPPAFVTSAADLGALGAYVRERLATPPPPTVGLGAKPPPMPEGTKLELGDPAAEERAEASRPFWRRGWFWAVVGGVAGVSAIVLIVPSAGTSDDVQVTARGTR